MAEQTSKIGGVFFLQWVLATSVGATVGGLIATRIMLVSLNNFGVRFPFPGMGLVNTSPGVISLILMPTVVPALLMGLAQWLVLRRLLAHSGWWVFATVLTLVPQSTGRLLEIEYGELQGVLATLTLAPLKTGDIGYRHGEPPAALALAALAVIVLPQWLVLRRHLSKASFWIIVALIAYLPFYLWREIGKYIIYNYTVYTLMDPPDRVLSSKELTVIFYLLFFIMHLLYGMITGAAMVWLLRKNVARLVGKLKEI